MATHSESEQPTTPARSFWGLRWWNIGALAILITMIAAWLFLRTVPSNRTPDEPEANNVEQAILPTNPGYVGPLACTECHAARVTEFQMTRHFQACVVPNLAAMPAGFNDKRTVPSPRDPATIYTFSKEGNELYQTVTQTALPRAPQFPHSIDLIYGSAAGSDEVYFSWKGNKLTELPAAWLHPTKEWGEQRLTMSQDKTRSVTRRCVECHNTWLPHIPGTENEYHRDGAILSVTCENCHGPGQKHVSHHRQHPGPPSREIVHPGTLSRERLMDVCAQCHSNSIRPRTASFSFRPGEPLDTHFRTHSTGNRENDHVADQVGYLRKSKCFQKSDSLTCITCHDPHKASDSVRVANACSTCHQSADCKEQNRLPVGAGANCVGCHMPRYPRVAVNFHTSQDRYLFPVRPHEHQIAVYPAARLEVLRAWYDSRPDGADKAAKFAVELSTVKIRQSEQLRKEHRYLEAIGAIREAITAKSTPQVLSLLREVIALQHGLEINFNAAERQFATRNSTAAIELLEGVLKEKPNWAQAHGKLGTLYAMTGDRSRAEKELQSVARHDPDDPYGYNMLGWLAYLDGNGADAVTYFRSADQVHPYTMEINYRWGLALLLLNRWSEAADRLRIAVEVDPKHAGSYQALSIATRKLGNSVEAIQFARKATRLSQNANPDILLTLADAYSAANRYDEAIKVAKDALAVAIKDAPETVPQIRIRVAELQRNRQ